MGVRVGRCSVLAYLCDAGYLCTRSTSCSGLYSVTGLHSELGLINILTMEECHILRGGGIWAGSPQGKGRATGKFLFGCSFLKNGNGGFHVEPQQPIVLSKVKFTVTFAQEQF